MLWSVAAHASDFCVSSFSCLDSLRSRAERLVGLRHRDRDYGLVFLTAPGERVPLAALLSVPQHVVVLVHGMDGPGHVWRDVIPALQAQGHVVAASGRRCAVSPLSSAPACAAWATAW